MNGLLRAKAMVNNVGISAKEITNISGKLTIEQVEEFANDYNLSLEQARHDLAEYIAYNNKLND